MDSEERHDLKENDLAEFFKNFGNWWNKYGNYVLIILILAAGGVLAYQFFSSRAEQRQEEAQLALANAITPEDYLNVAKNFEDPAVTTNAYLRGADLFLARAIGQYEAPPPVSEENANGDSGGDGSNANGGNSAGNGDGANSDDDENTPSRGSDLAQAEGLYQNILDMQWTASRPVYRVNALLGLGSVAESRTQWDAAKDYFDRAANMAEDDYPVLARQARQRRDLIDDVREPTTFAPESATQPASTQPNNAPSGFNGNLPGMNGNTGIPQIQPRQNQE